MEFWGALKGLPFNCFEIYRIKIASRSHQDRIKIASRSHQDRIKSFAASAIGRARMSVLYSKAKIGLENLCRERAERAP